MRIRALLAVVIAILVAVPSFAASRQTVTVDGEQAVILRDNYGVPHIIAPSMRSLFFANGYAVAQDRLLQIEKYRRGARGTAAAVLGKNMLENDKSVRLTGYTEDELQSQVNRLEPEYRQVVQAYADGINAYFADAKAAGTLPSEFKMALAAGLQWEPFEPADTAAIGAMMARRFGSGGGSELLVASVLERLKKRYQEATALRILDDVAWTQDPAAPTSISPEEGRGGMVFAGAGRENLAALSGLLRPEAMRGAYAAVNWGTPEWRSALGLPSKVGSYCVVIGPQRSASRAATLMGGPQMGFGTPQIAHEIHLMGPGLNFMGMGFAGVPGVLIGVNERVAWSTTSADADLEDVFVEKLNPENPNQYWHNGAWRDMERRVEKIQVLGQAPVEFEVFRTIHGPVIKRDAEKNIAYAHGMAYWGREVETLRAIAGFWRARNASEFAAAAAHITTSHNFFCATKDGDIGFWYCCKFPLRAGKIDRRLPIPGSGEYDWQGDVPFEKMPHIVNPKQGYIASWNNKPAVWWNPGDASGWGAIFRLTSIRQAVERDPVLTFTDFRDLQKYWGIHVYPADTFLPYIFSAAKNTGAGKDPRVGAALRQLRSWDGQAIDGSVPTAIFAEWLEAAKRLAFDDDLGDVYQEMVPGLINDRGSTLLLRVFQGKKAAVPCFRDYLNGEPKDHFIVRALRTALAELEKKYGAAQMSRWTYDQGQIKFDPLPWIPNYSRGTYIQVVECSEPDMFGVNILPPGQSEDPKSPHYGDQRELGGYWMFKPMILSRTYWDKEAQKQ